MFDSGPVGPSSSTEDDGNISSIHVISSSTFHLNNNLLRADKCVQVQKDETWIRRLIRGTELDDTLVRK